MKFYSFLNYLVFPTTANKISDSKHKRRLATIIVMIVAIALWTSLPKISQNIIVNMLITTIAMIVTLELSLKILKL